MSSKGNRIYRLSEASQAKITSSVLIQSLNDVILELVKNALDAQAENIQVTLDYAHGFCSTLDNGHGIPADEFQEDGGLGKPFCTSKFGHANAMYGHHGRYLAALAGVSLLSIASCTEGSDVHVLWLDDSGRLRNTTGSSDAVDFNTGTRVKVYGLFSKLPVRSRFLVDYFANHSEVQKEFDRLKVAILGLILAAKRPFSITIQHSSPKYVYKHVPYREPTTLSCCSPRQGSTSVHSAIRHAGYIESSHSSEWQEMSIDSRDIRLRGFISKHPMPHKLVQFIALNNLSLTKQSQPGLFQRINTLFEYSSFGGVYNTDTTEAKGVRHQPSLRGQSKEVDRWPMFVIWIRTSSDSVEDLLYNATMNAGAQKLLVRITNLVQTLVEEFLVNYGFSKPQDGMLTRSSEAPKSTVSSKTGPKIAVEDLSKESFRHWSRAKSSRCSVMDNILTGLPFHHKPGTDQGDIPTSKTADAPPVEHKFDDAIAAKGSNSQTAPLGPCADIGEQDQIFWVNVQTGRPLQIDPRTGIVLPDGTTTFGPKTVVNGDGHPTLPSPCSSLLNVKRRRCRKAQDLSLAEVAQNVRHYSKPILPDPGSPVRSIALFNYSGEDPNLSPSTQRGSPESFWASIDPSGRPLTSPGVPIISTEALRFARTLGQVDRKFILALMEGRTQHGSTGGVKCAKLVMIDQHAADERCKVEALFRSVREDTVITLTSPIYFEVSRKECQLLDAAKQYFAQWNISYELPMTSLVDHNHANHAARQVMVTRLPPVIAERCRLQPKLIIDILREEIWSERILTSSSKSHSSINLQRGSTEDHPSNTKSKDSLAQHPAEDLLFDGHIPPRLHEMINSRACRSAIMFNDELSTDQCRALVRQLGTCTLPFQCAHGRPSMVALASLDQFPEHDPLAPTTTVEENHTSFGQAFRTWTDPTRES